MRSAVARYSTRRRELAEEEPHARFVLCDRMVDLSVAALQIGIRISGRTTVSGTDDANNVGVALGDEPVQMCVDEVDARRGAPMTQKPFLNMIAAERLS